MDISLDLHVKLLRDRFPDSTSVESCEGLKNVLFCARNVNAHLYEGRLYMSEKALFFVSSYSSAVTFDKIIQLSDIQKAMFPRKVIPTMELVLSDGLQECFTNFHNLEKIVDVMKSLLHEDKVILESQKTGVYPNFNRMVSIPVKTTGVPTKHSFHGKQRHITPRRSCPYYSQSGFCPRGQFCRLPHTPHVAVFPPRNPYVMNHTSPDKAFTLPTDGLTAGQELMRSVSLPFYASDDGSEEINGELLMEDIQGVDGGRTPSPVSKVGTKPGTESSGPPIFDFANQDFNKGKIPVPPPLPPVPADLPGYKAVLGSYYGGYNSDEYEETPVEMPSVLTVYPASHLNRADINSGDKVILSVEILAACEQKQISFPMAFRFESKRGAVVYAGVLEFLSPLPNTAYLPQWMFDHLSLTEGEEVDFDHVVLPKGTFVQLQPVSSSWLGLAFSDRMSILEFQLRNFQTLTEGTKVTIVYNLNKYTFKVLQCKPGKGISIVDADLKTDVIEPADFNRFHSIEEWQAENIPLSEPVQCSITAGTYRHFVLLPQPGKELPGKLRVEVKHSSGDPDLFLCQTCSTPSQSRYTWCSQDLGDSTIHLSVTNDNYDKQKPVYAGIISLTGDAQFTVCFHDNDNGDNVRNAGHVLRSTTNDSAISTGSETEETDNAPATIPPNHQTCRHCGKVMPQLTILMHEPHCAQSSFTCPICKERFPNSMQKKHEMIAHQLLKCECGEELPQLALHQHQLSQCIKRSTKCQFPWCSLSFPLDQLQSHESLCGRKPVDCPVCSVEVSQLELKIHLEVYHQVEVEHVDWSKPIASQLLPSKPKEPRFKCHCGKGFEYEDDLQVHQLTECTMISTGDDQIVG